jgi:non-specific serine/threonine protein kinase
MPWPSNLPHRLTSFIGRERELDEVLSLLKKTRLLTLTGAGGSGKTRLALQAADLSRAIFPDGAWLVELATLADPRLVPTIVASTLGLREESDRSVLATLTSYLQPLHLLLILDNCEHLIQSVASLAQGLLSACPTLTILATSRQGLGIDGEYCWRVPSLSLPDARRNQNPAELQQYESVQLFVDRARQRRADFALNDDNAAAVAQLCNRLDGIPLAIELAAARIRVLSVEQIVERLDEQFRLLASPNQGGLPRHQTLEAMMDWSYHLLTDREQALFRALSVFTGGFPLEAVPAVEGRGLDEFSAIDLLSQLTDKSLLVVDEHSGEARYSMLEIIRQYAWKRAEEAAELDGLRARHLDWCVVMAEGTEDELVSSRQLASLERLESEHDNLRSALTYALTPHSVSQSSEQAWMGLRLAGALVWFWYFHGYLSEGRTWLESALSRAAAAEHPRRDVALAKALSAAGVLAYIQSDYAVAHTLLEQSLTVWHELEDKRGTAFALSFLGRVLSQEGDPLSRDLGERSVQLFREIDDRWGLALSLDFLGEEARESGRTDAANALHEQSLDLYRDLGHHWGVALELSHFAQVSLRTGDYAEAHRKLEEAVEIQRAVGDKSMLAWTLNTLGDVLLQEGRTSAALDAYSESLSLFREVEHRAGIAEALRKTGNLTTSGSPTFSPAARPASAEQLADDHDELTRREIEVLALIAEGLTDSQVAERLVLSTRTVQAHVRSIYSKLNITTRSAATRYAIRRGLV